MKRFRKIQNWIFAITLILMLITVFGLNENSTYTKDVFNEDLSDGWMLSHSDGTTPRGEALLLGLIKLGHDLGMKVLCEGVESETEKQRVREAGCDYFQGFYYSRVLPREEAELFYMRKQNGE